MKDQCAILTGVQKLPKLGKIVLQSKTKYVTPIQTGLQAKLKLKKIVQKF
jgi:hypothetical protein